MPEKGQNKDNQIKDMRRNDARVDAFVLDGTIFSSVFEKDIRRVYIYKKAERLAKAIHLIAPAFGRSPALSERMDRVAVVLVDAATLSPMRARTELSRELLALSSVLAIARTGGLLSPMNADIISREAHALLSEIATYEEPRLTLDATPTLAELFRDMEAPRREPTVLRQTPPVRDVKDNKGHVSDIPQNSARRDAILSVLRSKGPSYIKDISTVIRDVSEKTIQRELALLVEDGLVQRAGERRWTRYSLAT